MRLFHQHDGRILSTWVHFQVDGLRYRLALTIGKCHCGEVWSKVEGEPKRWVTQAELSVALFNAMAAPDRVAVYPINDQEGGDMITEAK